MSDSLGPSAGRPERPVRALRRRVAHLEAELDSLRAALRSAGIDVPAQQPRPDDAAAPAAPVAPPDVPNPAPPAAEVPTGHRQLAPIAAPPPVLPLTSQLVSRRDECRDDETTVLARTKPAARADATPRTAGAWGEATTGAAPAGAPASSVADASPLDVERFVGTKLAAWAGAVVVIGAMALFLKYAYDVGWLGRLSPTARLVGAYAFAALLVACGEVAMRRFGRLAGAGLFSAGVGTLYLAALAGYWPLKVMGPTPALVMATAVAVVGAALTVRSGLLAVGIVSLLGGYAAPILLTVLVKPGLAVPTHLTILLAVGLGLAGFASTTFAALRPMTVALQLVTGAIWFLARGWETPVLSILVFAIWWSMVCAEAISTALRGRAVGPCVGGMVVASLAVASVGAMGLNAVSPWRDLYSYVPLALSLLSAALAFQFGTGLDALRPHASVDDSDAITDDERRLVTSARTLGVALWGLAGLLLVAGLGVFLRHGSLAVAWIATAVIALELGRRLSSMRMASFGAALLWLGAAAAAVSSLLRTLGPRTRPPLGNGWWLDIPPGFTAGAIAVTALFLVAWRWSVAPRQDGDVAGTPAASAARGIGGRFAGYAAATCILATVMWMVGCLLRAGPPLALTLMLVPGIFLALAMHHSAIRWPRLLAAASFALVVGVWILMRAPDVFGRSEVVGLLIGPCGAVAGLWLLALRVPKAVEQEWLLVTSLAAIVVVVVGELFLDLIDGRASGRLRSDLAAVIVAALGMLALYAGRFGPWRLVMATGAVLAAGAGILWMLFGTLGPRMRGSFDEPVLVNATVGGGLAVIVAVAVAFARRSTYADADQPARAAIPVLLASLLVVLPVWLASFVIDSVLDPGRGLVDDGTPRQAALSACWGIAALALVGIGFARRASALRYAGLTALAIVTAKVVVVDMQGTGTIWRVLGLLAAGLLMVATSVLYVRLGKLFDERHNALPSEPGSE